MLIFQQQVPLLCYRQSTSPSSQPCRPSIASQELQVSFTSTREDSPNLTPLKRLRPVPWDRQEADPRALSPATYTTSVGDCAAKTSLNLHDDPPSSPKKLLRDLSALMGRLNPIYVLPSGHQPRVCPVPWLNIFWYRSPYLSSASCRPLMG